MTPTYPHHTAHYRGIVVSYDPQTHIGKAYLDTLEVVVKFHSTTFYSGRVPRPPRKGDPVTVCLSLPHTGMAYAQAVSIVTT